MQVKEKRTNRKGLSKQVAASYKRGMTNPYELAEKFNISLHYVYQILYREHILRARPAHNYKQPCEKTLQIIEDLRKGELTQKDIALKYGVARQWVSEIKMKYIWRN